MAGAYNPFDAVNQAMSEMTQAPRQVSAGGGLSGARAAFTKFRDAQARMARQMPQGSVQGMGASAGRAAFNGPLGKAPNHHGWAGLTDSTKNYALQLMAQFPELRFTSGFRDPARNKAAGGVANSGHTRGVKADFVGTPAQMRAAAAWLTQQGTRTLIHDAGSGNHLDVSWEGL